MLLLLVGYFLLFSVLPQDYGFLGKVINSVDKILADGSTDLTHTDPCNNTTEDDNKNSPRPLVEEEDSYVNSKLNYTHFLTSRFSPYRISNEYCNGIIISIPIPPPDYAFA